jgi:eukaryotic-like serine/threonine-protein kinase
MSRAARPKHPSAILEFADFRVDLRAGELHRNGARVRLQEQPFRLLALLMGHAGEVVTREELRQHLWPVDTFVDFDNSLNADINKIREALGDSAENPRFIETLPRRGYRFIAPVEGLPGNNRPVRSLRTASQTTAGEYPRGRFLVGALFLALALSAAGYWTKHRFGHRLTEKDTIILADFANSTGDSIFDGTLKQALEVQLQQSPFLSLVSNQDMQETLRFMGRSADEPVVGGVAREICQRQGAKAVLQGTIKSLGSHYVLSLNALNCQTGESLAADQEEVGSKEQVLAGLGSMASRVRGKLGESLAAVEKYDRSVLQATTPSLEALKAFSLGVMEEEKGNAAGSLPFFRRAIELDPNFALAHMRQYIAYWDIGEYELARESAEKAFALRERVSEREKLSITALYHDIVTGDLEKIFEADRVWAKTYPREWLPHDSLAANYNIIGLFDKAMEESTAAMRVAPHSVFGYGNLALAYQGLNRWQESRATLEQLIANGADDSTVYSCLYMVAFAQGDQAAMHKYLDIASKKLQEDDAPAFQFSQAEMAAFYGQLRTARELSERAAESAERVGFKQNAGAMVARAALWEAQLGNLQHAREKAKHALDKARGIDVELNAAVALAFAGDSRSAERIADNLARRHPEDTVLNAVSIPLIRSTIELERGNARQALELLKMPERYELGFGFYYFPPLMPSYIRGQAYLKLRESPRALAEFQKILDHRGVGTASLNYALAHLGLARAKGRAGDVAGAEIEYQDFFALWKDADPNIPILRDAKAEYAKLRY